MFILESMKHRSPIKNFILILLAWAIIAGGLFFGVHETLEHTGRFNLASENCAESRQIPLHNNLYMGVANSYIVFASEVRDVRVAGEVLKRIENNSTEKRIVILSFIICLMITEGAFFSSFLPSIFPWTSIITSRSNVIYYIHDQDGAK